MEMDSDALSKTQAARMESSSHLKQSLLSAQHRDAEQGCYDEGDRVCPSAKEYARLHEVEETRIANAISLAVKNASNLCNLLPGGTLLFFQSLLPIVSNGGACTNSQAYTFMTLALLLFCGTWCAFLPFTDTVKAPNGKLYHGIATRRGLWLPQSGDAPFRTGRAVSLARFHLRPIDFLHASLSLCVFISVALFTPNVSNCFFHSIIPQDLQNSVPLIVGFVASFLCIVFPSPRRNFDQPLLERLSAADE
ncbi:hypothetical protein KP509_01G083600 [Ceratopteris richardii]|uniref:Transmembrane protein n=1 Tax=Ceratopteris richardii TaxID=49495 RepID=A0A8T2VIP8_CERRI|nr:hypothetical protein KP509_01G083600 [Ceratopteris richardii]